MCGQARFLQNRTFIKNKNGVVHYDTDHHHAAQQSHHRHRHAKSPERQIHTEETERNGEHDEERACPRLHNRGNQQVGKDSRQSDNTPKFAGGLFHHFHASAHTHAVTGGQRFACHLADRIRNRTESLSGCGVGIEPHGADLIITVDQYRTGIF